MYVYVSKCTQHTHTHTHTHTHQAALHVPGLDDDQASESSTDAGTPAVTPAAGPPAKPSSTAWQQTTDPASGKPYWSLTRCVLPDDREHIYKRTHSERCVLPDDRARLPPPPAAASRALAPPAAYTVESRLPEACDRGLCVCV